MYDLIIIGGGPAGTAAGVYAARKKIKILLITESFGGQSLVSGDIRNWIGTKSISGFDLAKSFEEHLSDYTGDIDIVSGDLVSRVEPLLGNTFRVTTRDGKHFDTKAIFIASGSSRRKLGIPGEKEFDGRGVAYCATCDAPVFKDKTVVVVGGGNAGLEAVVDLFPYAKKTYLLVRSDSLKGDAITEQKIKTHPNVEIIFNVKALAVLGTQFMTGLRYEDRTTGATRELVADGMFVEIGSIPNSHFVKDLVRVNAIGEIIVDHKTQQSSLLGIWAAGDVSDVLYKQNNISAGDAIKAVLNIGDYLHKIH